MSNKILTVDVVPHTLNIKHLHTEIYRQQWDLISRVAYQRAGGQCECCGSTEGLVYHTAWDYNFEDKVSTVAGLELLCNDCYRAKSLDPFFAAKDAREMDLLNYLIKVNNWGWEQSRLHIEQSIKDCSERFKILWRVDLTKQKSWLMNKSPAPVKFLGLEADILKLKLQIGEYLADDQDARLLEPMLENYTRVGFREDNLVLLKSYLQERLGMLKKRFGKADGALTLFEVSEVVAEAG